MDLRGLCAIVLIASVLLAVLVLVAVSVVLLGAVAPYASRLSVPRISDTATTIGNL